MVLSSRAGSIGWSDPTQSTKFYRNKEIYKIFLVADIHILYFVERIQSLHSFGTGSQVYSGSWEDLISNCCFFTFHALYFHSFLFFWSAYTCNFFILLIEKTKEFDKFLNYLLNYCDFMISLFCVSRIAIDIYLV